MNESLQINYMGKTKKIRSMNHVKKKNTIRKIIMIKYKMIFALYFFQKMS